MSRNEEDIRGVFDSLEELVHASVSLDKTSALAKELSARIAMLDACIPRCACCGKYATFVAPDYDQSLKVWCDEHGCDVDVGVELPTADAVRALMSKAAV